MIRILVKSDRLLGNLATTVYTLSSWKAEKIFAIGSWIGSSLAMVRGGFLSAKERTALQAVMRHPSEIHGVARRANAILLRDDG